jgi:hypothetical protein
MQHMLVKIKPLVHTRTVKRSLFGTKDGMRLNELSSVQLLKILSKESTSRELPTRYTDLSEVFRCQPHVRVLGELEMKEETDKLWEQIERIKCQRPVCNEQELNWEHSLISFESKGIKECTECDYYEDIIIKVD